MSKKFLAKLLIFCMVFTMLPMSAFAATDIHPGGTGTEDPDGAVVGNPVYNVSLDAEAKTLTVGKTTTLTATVIYTVAPDTKVDMSKLAWTSSKEDVATVENGVVTAKAPGTTTITAIYEGSFDLCEVTVEAAAVQKYTVTFNNNGTVTTQTVEAGKTVAKPADPTRTGYKFEGWFVGDTAFDFTKAITADVTLTAKWTAEQGTVEVTGVTLNKTAVTLNSGATEKLTATVAPANATDKTVTWISSDTYVVSVDTDGTLTAKHSGTATVTANASGKTATCAVTVYAVADRVEVWKDSAAAEKITATLEGSKVVISGNMAANFDGTVLIGIFSTDGEESPSATLQLGIVDGNVVVDHDKFTVGKTEYTVDVTAVEVEQAPVVEAEAAVKTEVPATATKEEKDAAKNIADYMVDYAPVADGVVGVVSAVKSEVTDAQGKPTGDIKVANTTVTKTEADKIATEKLGTTDGVTTVVVPVPTFTVKGATVSEAGTVTALKFDIKLMAEVRVTTDPDNMNVITEENPSGNTAVVKSVEVPTNDEITIALPIPDNSISLTGDIFVNHTKANGNVYHYKATVIGTTVKGISFTSKHGFSEFEVTTNATFAASIGEEYFETLQAAVDAVQNDGVINVLTTGEHKATVSKEVKFTVNAVTGATVKIEAAGGYKVDTTGNVYTVTYAGGGTSGGGSSSNVSIATKVTGGKVTVTPTRPTRGQTVTINVTANEGYKLDTLVVTDNKGNNVELTKVSDTKYTFVMPAGKVTVTPTFVKTDAKEETKDPAAVKRFSDVASGAWYAEYITYVTENALMNGYDDGRFGPNDQTTRAQIVTVLYRLEGEPATRSSNSFSDVSAGGQYYSSAVAWAAINNIVNGYEDGRFGPNDNVTREQIAAILYRYATYKGYDTENAGSIAEFSDAAKVSSWANTAISWAVGEGLMNGDNGALRPQGNATRAEIAALLMRFSENIAK